MKTVDSRDRDDQGNKGNQDKQIKGWIASLSEVHPSELYSTHADLIYDELRHFRRGTSIHELLNHLNSQSWFTKPMLLPMPESPAERKKIIQQIQSEEVELAKPRANKGDPMAQFGIGLHFEAHGKTQAALEWYHKAANQGFAAAQINIAAIYEDSGNFREAAAWLEKAANQGNAFAQFKLACLYEDGLGVPVSAVAAKKLYQLASDQGDLIARCNLGSLLVREGNREGLKILEDTARTEPIANRTLGALALENHDLEKAFDYLNAAAKAGDSVAQTKLGLLYFDGVGSSPNYAAAGELFRLAADQGLIEAQYMLGKLYELVKKDFAQAAYWYQLAANQGHAESKEEVRKLKQVNLR